MHLTCRYRPCTLLQLSSISAEPLEILGCLSFANLGNTCSLFLGDLVNNICNENCLTFNQYLQSLVINQWYNKMYTIIGQEPALNCKLIVFLIFTSTFISCLYVWSYTFDNITAPSTLSIKEVLWFEICKMKQGYSPLP